MADKKEVVRDIINNIYGIASELLISADKQAQEHGRQLRRLMEQLENNIAVKKTDS